MKQVHHRMTTIHQTFIFLLFQMYKPVEQTASKCCKTFCKLFIRCTLFWIR